MGVIDENMREALILQGVDPDGATNLVAAVYAAFTKAMSGDINALNSLIKLMGEDNDTARLKLEQTAAKEAKTVNSDTGKLTELIQGLQDDIHE